MSKRVSATTYPRQRFHDRGPSVHGPEYDQRVLDMAGGSEALLRTLWRAHPGILSDFSVRLGRNVVQP